jgi:predicted O-methyltransferase YrrM
MFQTIPASVQARMHYLEEIDARDRQDGTPRSQRLRQITPETGRLLALLAASAPEGELVEIGTSAGYSTLWLTLAARIRGQTICTFELDPEKARIARETFTLAEVESQVELRVEDARVGLKTLDQIGFCFMDLDKEYYQACYDIVVPRLVRGGFLLADNAISHANELVSFLENVSGDTRVDSIVIPIGKGGLFCRRIIS